METRIEGQKLHIDLSCLSLPTQCTNLVIHLHDGIQLSLPAPANATTLAEATPSVDQLREYAQEYLADLKLRKNYKTGISLRDKEKHIEAFAKWLEERSNEVTSQHWRDYYFEKKSSRGTYTIRNYFRSLEPFCRWLAERQHIYTNPLEDITPPSPSKESVHIKAISAEGAELMIENAGSIRDRALIIFFRDTACRLSEAQAMQWEKIDWQKGGVYTIGKFHKPRILYMTAPTKEALRKYQQSRKPEQTATGAVWLNEKTGEGLSSSGIYQVFRRITDRVEKR